MCKNIRSSHVELVTWHFGSKMVFLGKASSYVDNIKGYYVADLMLDSIWILLFFYCKFCAFRIILFYIVYFYFYFIQEQINQTYTIASLAFQVYKIGFRTFLSQLVSILRVKL